MDAATTAITGKTATIGKTVTAGTTKMNIASTVISVTTKKDVRTGRT